MKHTLVGVELKFVFLIF